jgi:hypothetical protein
MVDGVLTLVDGWDFDVVSVGVPTPVRGGKVIAEPVNLGDGWVGFDVEGAFGKPTKVVNDAVMQAIGSYEGRRMLFLSLGTGLGSAFIAEGVVEPLELAHLPFRKKTFEDYVGEAALHKNGKEEVDEDGLRGRRRAHEGDGAGLRRAWRGRHRRAQGAAGRRSSWQQRERLRRRVPPLGPGCAPAHLKTARNLATSRSRIRDAKTGDCPAGALHP